MKRFTLASLIIGTLFAAIFYLGQQPGMAKVASFSPTLSAPSARHASSGISSMAPLAGLMQLPEALEAQRKVSTAPNIFMSQEEKEKRAAFFSDKARIDIAKAYLLQEEKGYDFTAEQLRMKAVDFLATSLRLDQSPSHDYAVAAVSTVLSTDNIGNQTDMKEKKSLAGDKVELFEILNVTDPSVAAQLLESTKGTVLFNVLSYAKKGSDRLTGAYASR